MSVEVNESISSLIDGELDAVDSKKVLDKLKHESDHQNVWARYHLISQALKKDLPASPSNDLFLRVQAAVDSEPALLSPSPSSITPGVKTAEVVELPKKPEVVEAKNNKALVGFAVAASFTLMTVLGFQFLSSNNEINPGMPIASSETAAPTQEVQVVNIPSSGVTTASTAVEEPLYAEQSVINDGQWTRITHIGNMSLNGRLIGQTAESHANVSIRGNAIPFARAVNVDDAAQQ